MPKHATTPHPLDDAALLHKWGFATHQCCYCHTHNSALEGRLLQCGKCKKAYYCSKQCFNADLNNHTLFCQTSGM